MNITGGTLCSPNEEPRNHVKSTLGASCYGTLTEKIALSTELSYSDSELTNMRKMGARCVSK